MSGVVASIFRELEQRGTQPVALGSEGNVSARALLEMAAGIAGQLPDSTPNSEVALSFGTDCVAFMAALLASWARGHTVALPEDGSRDNIIPVFGRPNRVAFLHDTGVGIGLDVPAWIAAEGAGLESLPEGLRSAGDDWESSRALVLAFRQSALGESRLASWTSAELERELERGLRAMELPRGVHVVSSLSPMAVPTLLLGLLTPIRAHATFAARFPTQRVALARAIAGGVAHTLVVTPAHARELLCLSDGIAVESARGGLAQCIAVDEGFDAPTREALAGRWGARIIEMTGLPLGEERLPFEGSLIDALMAHPSVRDAGLLHIDASAEQAVQYLIAVAAPPEAEAELQRLVRAHAPSGEACQLRAVDSVPRDDNGRLQAWRVGLIFGYGRSGALLSFELEWETVEASEPGETEEVRQRTRIPEHYAFLEGHYVGYPVLAGAAQLTELVLPCARRLEPGLGSPRRLSGLKFLARISTGDELEVVVRRGTSPGDYRFEILSGERRCSIGRLQFAEPAGPPAQ